MISYDEDELEEFLKAVITSLEDGDIDSAVLALEAMRREMAASEIEKGPRGTPSELSNNPNGLGLATATHQPQS